MIKLTVDARVGLAMKTAFPNKKVEQRLNKYVQTLEKLILQSIQYGQTPGQRLLNLFSISTHDLTQKGGDFRTDGKKISVHKWLKDNGLALIEPVIKGSKFSGKVSECKLTDLATIENMLAMPLGDALESMTDSEIDIFLAGNPDNSSELITQLYPGLQDLDETQIREQYDIVDIDIESLKNYIAWLSTMATHYSATSKTSALRDARIILAAAQASGGIFLQRIKPSIFGRTYYAGVSVQSVKKDLRGAMLGNCWLYDIRSSVTAWKMGFASEYIASMAPKSDVRTEFSTTINFLEDKRDFLATVRHYTFKGDSACSPDLQKKLIKQAITAIGFGARLSKNGWFGSDGRIHNPALVDILKNADERDRFFNCPSIRGFISEQKILDDFIYGLVKSHNPELLKLSNVQTHSGRPSKAKVLAYLYQHGETQVMDIAKQVAKDKGHEILAHIHDAFVIRKKLGVDLKCEIELKMREKTGNPYWRMSAEELKRFAPRGRDIEVDAQSHRQGIREEEAKAKKRFKGPATYVFVTND